MVDKEKKKTKSEITLADLEGVIKQRKKIEDNPLEKEEERKSCMFV